MVEKAINKAMLEIIRASIAAKNLKKKDIARKLRISKSLFSMKLNGDSPMSMELADKIFTILALDKEQRDRVFLSTML